MIDGDAQNNIFTKKRSIICEQCHDNQSRYCCPKCEMRTCSLECINIHKNENSCDGIRDKTSYIPLRKLTDLELLSDYRLLEEADRSVESCKRKKLFENSRSEFSFSKKKLLNVARKKGIQLTYLPVSFSRHKSNKSRVVEKTKILWQIEWTFPLAENLVITDNGIRDDVPLQIILSRRLKLEDLTDSAKEKMKSYLSFRIQDLSVFLKVEGKEKKSEYIELDIDETLAENFKGKNILENPKMHVVYQEHRSIYINDEVHESD